MIVATSVDDTSEAASSITVMTKVIDCEALSEGDSVGLVGDSVGISVGAFVEASAGEPAVAIGASDGTAVGAAVGDSVGTALPPANRRDSPSPDPARAAVIDALAAHRSLLALESLSINDRSNDDPEGYKAAAWNAARSSSPRSASSARALESRPQSESSTATVRTVTSTMPSDVGSLDGAAVGALDGVLVLGPALGLLEGAAEGNAVVGAAVGLTLGDADGTTLGL